MGDFEKYMQYQLIEIARDCGEKNWDGMGADPISAQIVREARAVLQHLPAGIPAPDITPCPDGSIDLTWKHGENEFVFGMYGTGLGYYSGIFEGGEKVTGKVALAISLPDNLQVLILRAIGQAT